MPDRYGDIIAKEWAETFVPHAVPGAAGVEHWLELRASDDAFGVHVVPFVGDRVIVIRPVGRGWEMPGGRCEAGESLDDTAQRELFEEAGARIESLHEFATMWFRWTAPLHTPRTLPVAVAWAEAALVGPPSNPSGEVATEEVAVIGVEEAIGLLRSSDRDALAACYAVARKLRDMATGARA